jgi:hypothetical protein
MREGTAPYGTGGTFSGIRGNYHSDADYESACKRAFDTGLVTIKIKNVRYGRQELMMRHLQTDLGWKLHSATLDLCSVSPSRNRVLCWFFVWMHQSDYDTMGFVDGVMDLSKCPIADVQHPAPLYAELDLLHGVQGYPLDALAQKLEGEFYIPGIECEMDMSRFMYRISMDLRKAFRVQFDISVRKKFMDRASPKTTIVIAATRTEKQRQAVRAVRGIEESKLKTGILDIMLAGGTFRFVKYNTAKQLKTLSRIKFLEQRYADDHRKRGRRMTGALHQGVTEQMVADRITQLGIQLEDSVCILGSGRDTVVHFTTRCLEDTLQLLNADVCGLLLKAATPRNGPREAEQSDLAWQRQNVKDRATHGAAHGLTEDQIRLLVASLKTASTGMLQSVVDNFTGSLTGLPEEFRQAVGDRLDKIEQSLRDTASAAKANAAKICVVNENVCAGFDDTRTRLARMEGLLHDLVQRTSRLGSEDVGTEDLYDDDMDAGDSQYFAAGEAQDEHVVAQESLEDVRSTHQAQPGVVSRPVPQVEDPYSCPTDKQKHLAGEGFPLGLCTEAVAHWNEVGQHHELLQPVDTRLQTCEDIIERARCALSSLSSSLLPPDTPKAHKCRDLLALLSQRYPDSIMQSFRVVDMKRTDGTDMQLDKSARSADEADGGDSGRARKQVRLQRDPSDSTDAFSQLVDSQSQDTVICYGLTGNVCNDMIRAYNTVVDDSVGSLDNGRDVTAFMDRGKYAQEHLLEWVRCATSKYHLQAKLTVVKLIESYPDCPLALQYNGGAPLLQASTSI